MYRDFNHLHLWLPPRIARTGLSIEDFARKVGISRDMIYRYFRDQARPTTKTMARICKVLKVPLIEGLKQYADRRSGPK